MSLMESLLDWTQLTTEFKAELENKSIETPQTEEQRKKKKRLAKMKQYSRTIRK